MESTIIAYDYYDHRKEISTDEITNIIPEGKEYRVIVDNPDLVNPLYTCVHNYNQWKKEKTNERNINNISK